MPFIITITHHRGRGFNRILGAIIPDIQFLEKEGHNKTAVANHLIEEAQQFLLDSIKADPTFGRGYWVFDLIPSVGTKKVREIRNRMRDLNIGGTSIPLTGEDLCHTYTYRFDRDRQELVMMD